MQTTITYTEALIRKAIFRFWLRFIGWHGFAAIAVCSAICLWAAFWQTNPWIASGTLLLWAFGITANLGLYVVYLRRSLRSLRRMNDPTAEITISNDEFRVKHSLADSRVQWRLIEAIWRFPEAWLLFTGKNAFMTLPIDAVSMEDRQLMCAKVKENGGRVV